MAKKTHSKKAKKKAKKSKAAKTEKADSKMGRPKKLVDWTVVENLCGIGCTGEEIASVLGIDYDTLNARIKETYGITFSEYFPRHEGRGKASLRRVLHSAGMAGNIQALLHLAKTRLGLSERVNLQVSGPDGGDIRFRNTATEDLSDELKQTLENLKLLNALELEGDK